MSNLIRSAKSGSDWTQNELLAYNITITPVSPDQFFHPTADPPLDQLDPALLTLPLGADDPGLSDAAAEYLGYLDLATGATQENHIDDFAAQTLKLLRFNERNMIVCTRYIIPFTICSETRRTAQTDVCVVHRPTLILLVLVSDKTLSNSTDAESQVVAEAIATFQFNNHKREEKGRPRLNAMTIPCITMSGTRPTFYLVPITEKLSNAVITGQYPVIETRVLKCVTAPTRVRRASEGMEHPEYRRLAFRRFLAFKALAKRHWESILQGY